MGVPFGNDLLLLDKLGSGGMADVFRAKRTGSGGFEKIVAVKRIQPHHALRVEVKAMFEREISLTSKLQHPNIVQVFNSGDKDGTLFLVMEYVHGRTLASILSKLSSTKKHMPYKLTSLIGAEVAKGLAYAHNLVDLETGRRFTIVHRDISPQNIMVGFNGEVKILDFGIAKVTDSTQLTRFGDFKGKASYSSPEQVQGKRLDGRSDLFSLGVVLHELLTGQPLFWGESSYEIIHQVTECKIPDLSLLDPSIPDELIRITKLALTKDLEERYQSADSLCLDLTKFINSEPSPRLYADLGDFMTDLFDSEIRSKQYGDRSNDTSEDLSRSEFVTFPGLKDLVSEIQNKDHRDPQYKTPINNIAANNLDGDLSTPSYAKVAMLSATLFISAICSLIGYHELYKTLTSRPITLPNNIPGLVAEFLPEMLQYPEGSSISLIEGSETHSPVMVQTETAAQPVLHKNVLNGYSVLSFDGVDDFLIADEVGSKLKDSFGVTIIYLTRARSNKTHYVFSAHEENRVTDIFRGGYVLGGGVRIKTSRYVGGTNYNDSEKNLNIEQFSIYSAVFGTEQAELYQNGIKRISAKIKEPIQYNRIKYLSIGQEWDPEGTSDHLHGDLGELLVYDRALDPTERAEVELYLSKKYGISIQLS